MSSSHAIDYLPEDCATCKGSGYTPNGPCKPCEGKGKVLVYQPPRACPRCKGTGKIEERKRVIYLSPYCLVCQGTGWVMTEQL
jgi:DnaJ-class molecular chaperone